MDFPNDYKALRGLGGAYSLKKDSVSSDIYFKKSLAVKPNDSETYYRWGEASINTQNYLRGVELLTYAINNNCEFSEVYERLGFGQSMLHDTTAALNSFSKAIIIDPQNRDAFQSRINLMLNNKKSFRLVRDDIDKVLNLAFDTLEICRMYALRSFYDVNLGDTTRAIIDSDRAVAAAVNKAYPYILRAMVNIIIKKNKNLILMDLTKAIDLDPSFLASIYDEG